LQEWASDQNDKPSVSLSAPADLTQVDINETVTLIADALDPSGREFRSEGEIVSVAFLANGALIGSVDSAPYQLSWMVTDEQVYSVVAVVTDADGNTANSEPIEIVVGNQPPQVTLSSHHDYDNLSLDQSTTISSTVVDFDGTVQEVAFFANGDLLGRDSSAPYQVDWIPDVSGEFVLTARALDDSGKMGAASVTVTAGANVETTRFFAVRDDDIYSNAPDDTGHYSTVQMRSNGNVNVGLFGFDISALASTNQIRLST